MATEDPFRLVGSAIENKHRIDHVVDEGGFAVVYRGYHLGFEQPIAVKCLKVPPHFTGPAHALFLAKFREEGKHLARLSEHRSVVRVYDYGITKGPTGLEIPFLVLEWLEGATLEAHLIGRAQARLGGLGESTSVTLLRPAIEAIGFAHRLGIAHRDLKPANLFLARTALGDVLKVFDFGIAKAMQEGETATRIATRTTSGFSAFTPRYGAPEQFRSKRYGATGPWTDVHALGLILVECATGRPALEGEEDGDYFVASTADVRPTPRARGAQVSDGFEQVCAKALALLPAERYRHAGELLEALDALGAPRDGASPPTQARDRTVLEMPASVVASTSPEAASPYAGADAAQATVWPPLPGETRRDTPAPAKTEPPAEPPAAPAPAITERPGERTDPQPPSPAATQHRAEATVATGGSTVLSALSAVRAVTAPGEPTPEAPQPRAPVRAAPLGGRAKLVAGAAVGLIGVAIVLALVLGRHGDESAAGADTTSLPLASGLAGAHTASGSGSPAAPVASAEGCPAPMKSVPAGELQMGCAPADSNCLPAEKPLHRVPMQTYCIDETLVTVADYRKCAQDGGCLVDGLNGCAELGTWNATGKDEHPIVCVTWQQADAYCRWARKRLPTEEEWEYAARGKDLRIFPWGDEPPTGQLCWKRWQKARGEGEKDKRDGTCSVGSHLSGASPFGLLDMVGNVWEWTASDYRDGYDAAPIASERVIRGGFWGSNSLTEVRVSSRNHLKTGRSLDSLGFRCAK